MNEQLDKTIWKWLLTKGGKPQPSTQLITIRQHQLLWDYIFEKESGATGSTLLRYDKVISAIRLRSKAYRLAGVKPASCTDTALKELAGHITVPEVKRLIPPPRRLAA